MRRLLHRGGGGTTTERLAGTRSQSRVRSQSGPRRDCRLQRGCAARPVAHDGRSAFGAARSIGNPEVAAERSARQPRTRGDRRCGDRRVSIARISRVIPRSPYTTPVDAMKLPFFGMTHADMVHVSNLGVLLTPDANRSDLKTVGFYGPVGQKPFYAGLGLLQLPLDEWLPRFGKGSGKPPRCQCSRD